MELIDLGIPLERYELRHGYRKYSQKTLGYNNQFHG